MCDDVSSDRLRRVSEERVGLGHDLVGYEDGDVMRVGDAHERVHVFVELLLAVGKCSSAYVFCSEMACERVYDDEPDRQVLLGDEVLYFLGEEHLVVRVVGACDLDASERLIRVESHTFGELADAFGSERVLRIDVHAVRLGLCEYDPAAQVVCELGLSRSELSEGFGDRTGFDASCEHGIEAFDAETDLLDELASVVDVFSRLEAHVHGFA